MRKEIRACVSSENPDWMTPPDLFNYFDEVFNFTFDLAASADNALCAKYFTKEDDALSQDWDAIGGNLFCNPPYGRKPPPLFTEKAVRCEAKVFMLLAARIGSAWFHRAMKDSTITVAPNQRIKFRWPGKKNGAPFPSSVMLFNDDVTEEQLERLLMWGDPIGGRMMYVGDVML